MTTKYSMSTTQTPLSKSLLAGLASGIVATMVNLVFNYVYRSITGLTLLHSIINVETIIFFSIIAGTVAGLLFHFFVNIITKGVRIYMLAAITLSIAALLAGFAIKRGNETFNINFFRGLYAGIIIITGAFASFLLPWLTQHRNPFFNQPQ